MKANFVTIEGKSRSYKVLVAILAVLAFAGFVGFAIAYVEGHQMYGGSNVIPWGMPIVLTIYLIGLSAGSLILSSLTYVFGREEYRPIARMAVFLAIVLIFGAMLSIAIDLGRPEKFWRLFMFFYLNNMTSMFAINGILYGGYFGISLVYLGSILANKPKFTRTMGMIAVGWAVLVHMGTGAIFGFIAARECWVSPVKPFEFLACALTSGVAFLIVMVIITLKFSGRDIKKEMITSLGNFLLIFIITLFLLIFMDKLTHFYHPAREAAEFLLAGPYSWMFWGLQEGVGAFIPLAILLHPKLRKTIRGVALAAVLVVIGIFFERYYLVIPCAAYPMQYYPGTIEGVWGAVASFPLTPCEMVLSVGMFALLGLLFVMGLKYLELLPAKESTEVSAPEKAPASEETPAQLEESASTGEE